ncbi:MAG: cytosine permease [Zoogloeaceae bacterium]|jgi:cytosine permease|nr:cytosine permease [Zoogloeaceae bacterium]
MTTLANSVPLPASRGHALKAAAEDHALVAVPQAQRHSGWWLALSPVGVATALVIFAIGGFTVMLAGFKAGLLAGCTIALFGATLGILMGRLTHATGLSSTVTARFFGFGYKGSSLGSLTFAFMILGFLAVESALLYEGTLLMFHLEESWKVRICLYTALTLLWVLLAIFGLKLALRASAFCIVVTILVTIYMVVDLYVIRQADPLVVFNGEGNVQGSFWTKFSTALGVMGATAGTIALLTADFARYCRNRRDITILAVSGPVAQNIVMTILGALVIMGGLPHIMEYLMARNAGLTPEAAAQAAGGFAMGNTGAFFVILAGWVGFLTIYVTQAKAQAINAYSGSLALVNLADTLLGRKPGRAAMVIVGNLIALAMIASGILGQFIAYLSWLGAMTLALCGVMIADYYGVRRGHFDHNTHQVENWNWAGVTTWLLSAGLGIWMIASQVFELGFFVSFLLACLLYPVLRKVLPEGSMTDFVSEDKALREAG